MQISMIKKQKEDRERYISPEQIQEIIDEMRLKQCNNLIDNIIADAIAKLYEGRIKKVSKNSGQNYSERELEMRMVKKYLQKNIYLQKEGRKLLIILILI